MGPLRRYTLLLMLLAALSGGCATTESPATPAVGPQSSWEEIRATPGLLPRPPSIAFGTRSVSVMNACISGDILRATAGDGTTLEKPAAGIAREYQIGVGRQVGDAETSSIRILFYKSFAIPACS